MYPKDQFGFTFLEVLVAFLILSVSLLTFAQAELNALRKVQQAYWISMATLSNSAMAEQLRACRDQYACVNHEKQKWQTETSLIFPGGKPEFVQQGPYYLVRTRWHDPGGHSFFAEELMTRP